MSVHYRGLRWTMLVLVLGAGACLDDLFGPGTQPPEVLNFASDTSLMADLQASAGTLALASPVAFVSLPQGTVTGGSLARILVRHSGGTQKTVAVTEGGFDPVAVIGAPGDTVEIEVTTAPSGSVTLLSTIPSRKRPVVIRTLPPRRKTAVPLNALLSLVFSEPIDRGTINESTILLMKGGAAVDADLVIDPSGLSVEVRPRALLESGTTYLLVATNGIRDLDGDALESFGSEFTTGTTMIDASVYTDQAVSLTVPDGGNLRAFQVGAVRLEGGDVIGRFSIHYPSTGARVSGPVTCMTIVDGRAAWMGGTVDESGNAANIGKEFVWRLVDNGPPGGGAADQLSLATILGTDWTISAADFCATMPVTTPAGELTLHTLASGDIRVSTRESLAPPPTDAMSRIAYAAWPNGGIRSMRADGLDARAITTVQGDWAPTWSPDGSRIAFSRTAGNAKGIYVVNQDGSGVKRLTNPGGGDSDSDPEWSPLGNRIAFVRSGAIYAIDADGANARELTSVGLSPSWSPDGSRIAFIKGNEKAAVHTMAADGSNIVRVSDDTLQAKNPAWSPDGRSIVFHGRYAIFAVGADGTNLRRVAFAGQTPSWSPDGQMIVYEMYGLQVVNADGTGLTRRGTGFMPSWSRGEMPARPGTTRDLELVSGNNQRAARQSQFAQPLVVRVRDANGAPVQGARVNLFAVGAAGLASALSTLNVASDADGIVSVTLKAGLVTDAFKVIAQLTDGSARTQGVEFDLSVIDPAAAYLRFTISTTGVPPDTTGYTVCYDSAEIPGWDCNWLQTFESNETRVIPIQALLAQHKVELLDVDANCTVTGESPRFVPIVAGDTTKVDFNVQCKAFDTLMPYQAADYRFKVLDRTASSGGFEQPAFDDSGTGWMTGAAPFGSPSWEPCPRGETWKTEWHAETDILIRRKFNVSAGTANVRIGMAIDDDMRIWLNGTEVTNLARPYAVSAFDAFAHHGGCASLDFFVIPVPPELIKAGENLIAVRGRDNAQESFFDMRVIALKP